MTSIVGYSRLIKELEFVNKQIKVRPLNSFQSHYTFWSSNHFFADNGKCFGGIARLKKSVDDIKYSHENVIFLNGGDFYQGNIWFSLFKWEIVAKFAELLNFTAMVSMCFSKLERPPLTC